MEFLTCNVSAMALYVYIGKQKNMNNNISYNHKKELLKGL